MTRSAFPLSMSGVSPGSAAQGGASAARSKELSAAAAQGGASAARSRGSSRTKSRRVGHYLPTLSRQISAALAGLPKK